MKSTSQEKAATDKTMERRIIRVELPSANAGVTAALRRAFAGAVPRPGENGFEALLRRLN